MKLTNIRVKNYKGLRDAVSPLSSFVCTIGENNAGKSSFLQAILLFINGTKISKNEFYNPNEDVLITVTLQEITEDVLAKLTDEHRPKVAPFVIGGCVTLARRYSTDGTSKLRVVTSVPKETRFDQEIIDSTFSGKRGDEIGKALAAYYPEALGAVTDLIVTTQRAAKDLVEKYIATLPVDQFEPKDIPLPTGIDNSIRSILPEPVYIPAVKDFSDELKTKESASFGKLLNILLDVIEGDLTEAAETFESLRKKLNRVIDKDGNVHDGRMEKVKAIEETIQNNLQETFKNVSIELEIPPPEIKAVLSNASILADDGVRGSVEHKGDGFKRAITFSVLRSYVQLSQDRGWRKDSTDTKPVREKFIFLFEEPELYLHPRAQNILFDALALISKHHQVIVTTHSPLFFSADTTSTFIKMVKSVPSEGAKPVGICCPIDLGKMGEKDKFQMISFESSNLAFFSSKIVLVEGDSDLIVLPHIARLLDQRWDFKATSTCIVKISGKGSFKRYREFFDCFQVKVSVVADLDVLIKDFDKLAPTDKARELLSELMRDVDAVIESENKSKACPPRLVKEELQRARAKTMYDNLVKAREAGDIEEQGRCLDEFFVFEMTTPRLEVLADRNRKEIVEKKRVLLAELRLSGIFVLERGPIESYYPDEVSGSDKPSKAQSFCSLVKTVENLRPLSDLIGPQDNQKSELEVILSGIFQDSSS